MTWTVDFERRLDARRMQGLLRRRITVDGPQSSRVQVDGRLYVSFCSNDYLGLANDRRLVSALQRAADRYGVGAGASHLITGHLAPHEDLEAALAEFLGAPKALVFSTGYMANLGVVNALSRRGDLLLEDRLNHASLIDAGLLARAQLRRYAHADCTEVRRLLSTASRGRTLILTDAVFSMDGDLAPLPELISLAAAHDARLIIDDAHGFGVLGDRGRGSLEQSAIPLVPPVIMMGTLGKALGTFGAFVAGEALLIETLIQEARTYIYTTAPPPALAAATCESLRIVREESWRRERLRAMVARFRRGAAELGLPIGESGTPIQPVIVGESKRAVAASRTLQSRGILVTAIRPPTVPPHSARLRVTFSATHTDEDVDRLLDGLAVALSECQA